MAVFPNIAKAVGQVGGGQPAGGGGIGAVAGAASRVGGQNPMGGIGQAIAGIMSPLIPTPTLPVSPFKLIGIINDMMAAKIKYKLGEKANMHTPIAKIKEIDCSGFVQYAIYHATNGGFRIPGGSWNQDDWFKAKRMPVIDYKSEAGAMDFRVRVAFIHGGKIGHAWLVLNGMTMESHGHKGPDRRPWNNATLLHGVKKAYVLT